jgi:hypothetical protein
LSSPIQLATLHVPLRVRVLGVERLLAQKLTTTITHGKYTLYL